MGFKKCKHEKQYLISIREDGFIQYQTQNEELKITTPENFLEILLNQIKRLKGK